MSGRASRWYIESLHFDELVRGEPVCVLDGGSSGGTFAPFDDLDAVIEVAAFDPDPRVVTAGTIPMALWDRSGSIEIRLASPGVSSVYPPDHELLRWFPERVGTEGRRTEDVMTAQAISIDDAVAAGLCRQPDFIKLDIHSAEFEALFGATNTLRTTTGVLVETWHAPVHLGQHLHGDVERLLNDHKFHLFDLCPAAAWRYTIDGEGSVQDRPRLIASESLFFRDLGDARELDARTAFVAIALLDLYGYTNYALRLNARFGEAGAIRSDEAAAIDRNLRALRDERERSRLRSRDGTPWRMRLRAALRALGGRISDVQAGISHPLESGTQRLSRTPWR